MKDCVFCKMLSGEIKISPDYQNDHAFLIRDRNPIAPQHMLAITKEHFQNVSDMNSETRKNVISAMFDLIDEYVRDLKLNDGGYRIVTNSGKNAGQTVQHLHFHVIAGAPLKNDFGA